MPTSVTVTGKTLLFPQICACCGGASNATFNIQDRSVKTTTAGPKTTKTTTTVTWPIPICTTCEPHNPSDDFQSPNSWEAGPSSTARSLIDVSHIKEKKHMLWLGIVCGLTLGFVGWALFAEGKPGRAVGDARHKVAVVAAIVLGGLGFGLVFGTSRLSFNRQMREALENNELFKKQQAELAAKEAKLDATRGPQCCKGDQRAAYLLDGTSENETTFTFQRKDFADAFIGLNKDQVKKSKLVRSYMGV